VGQGKSVPGVLVACWKGSPAPSLTPAPSLWGRALLHLGNHPPTAKSPPARSHPKMPLYSTTSYQSRLQTPRPVGRGMSCIHPEPKTPMRNEKHVAQGPAMGISKEQHGRLPWAYSHCFPSRLLAGGSDHPWKEAPDGSRQAAPFESTHAQKGCGEGEESVLDDLRSYLRLCRNSEMRGNADIGHFAIYGKRHRGRQRVVHLDGGGHSLPNSGGHFNGAEGSRSSGLESHHVVQVLLGHLIKESHLN